MDNVCHTLVGAALSQAGLNRRTRFASATLLISANLPDVDALVFATSVPALAFRRGWTHGLAAQVLLPLALTAVMLLVARLRPAYDERPARALWLLALSYLGVTVHVLLDLLNTYGVRLLAPFDWRWFYGDAVFILDPWLWVALGTGVWLSRRWTSRISQRPPARPARVALVAATLYIAAMCVNARLAREVVLDAWRGLYGAEPQALMVGPVPASPLHWTVVVDAGDHYATGTFTWIRARVTFSRATVPKNDGDPRVARAREARLVRGFLVWSRFPVWTFDAVPGGTQVSVGDMRFVGRGGFAARVVIPDGTDIISQFQ